MEGSRPLAAACKQNQAPGATVGQAPQRSTRRVALAPALIEKEAGFVADRESCDHLLMRKMSPTMESRGPGAVGEEGAMLAGFVPR